MKGRTVSCTKWATLLWSVTMSVSHDGVCFVTDINSQWQVIELSNPRAPSVMSNITVSMYWVDASITQDGKLVVTRDDHKWPHVFLLGWWKCQLLSWTPKTYPLLYTSSACFVTDINSQWQAIDLSNPSVTSYITISMYGVDTSITPDGKYVVSCMAVLL